MMQENGGAQHDAYAAAYDELMRAYDCHLPDVLFGLCYEYTCPGQVVLDGGIGTGLAARLFTRAGLQVYGMDFSPAMLAICHARGFAAGLTQHDLTQVPWPHAAGMFDHVICCGVLHFIGELEPLFAEARRVLRPRGVLAFTTKRGSGATSPYERQDIDGFAIYAHHPAYLEALLSRHTFEHLKTQRCLVGNDQFTSWVARAADADH